MRNFKNSIKTKKYIIGCTGATTYIYDLSGNLIKKFNDIPYGYTPYISKCERYLCVKSTDRRLAFYDLEDLALIKKILLKDDEPQDDEALFLANGDFINIQLMKDLNHDIVIYQKETFDEKKRYKFDKKYIFSDIEEDDNALYFLGFERLENKIQYKVFKIENDVIIDFDISEKEHFSYSKKMSKFKSSFLKDVKELNLNIDKELVKKYEVYDDKDGTIKSIYQEKSNKK